MTKVRNATWYHNEQLYEFISDNGARMYAKEDKSEHAPQFHVSTHETDGRPEHG